MIDWEFELEKAQGIADSKEFTEVLDLRHTGGKLARFHYRSPSGLELFYDVPEELEKDGFCRMDIDGLPIELTKLPGDRLELFFPVGMHDHAKKW